MGAPYRDSMPFTIQDVLNNLGLPVKAEKRGVLILDCPFCLGKNGQPDRHGHMEVDLARDRYRCHRCGRMGGKLDLYMAGHPQVLDAKQAYREMMEYLEGPRKGAPRFIPQALSLPPSLETEKRASAQQLHETYSALLEMLTLTSTHRQNLRDRGLEDGEIDRLAYRSVPTVGQRRLAAELMGAGCALEGVPGFYLDERERWTLYTWRSGIIMPERDSEGRILGLQVRKDQAEKHKCYWITGAKQKLGAPHACGLHFARPQAACQTGAAYLTEGIMKADIAAWFSDRCFLAVPGVSHYSAVRNALPACRELGIHRVIVGAIAPYFEERMIPLDKLTTMDIQNFYSTLKQKGNSGNTILHYHANIRKSLADAVKKYKLIPYNPAADVTRPKIDNFVSNYYDAQQLAIMLDAFKGSSIELPVTLAAFYGFRRSEVLGLKWSAIDFKNNTLTVSHTVSRAKIDGKTQLILKNRTKNKSSFRSLPLIPQVKQMLLQAREKQKRNQKVCKSQYNTQFLEYICVDDMGNLLYPDRVSRGFCEKIKKLDLPYIRFHDLRHSCASLLLANGISLKEIRLWLGHSNFATTANIYAHLDMSSKQASAATIAGCLSLNPSISPEKKEKGASNPSPKGRI